MSNWNMSRPARTRRRVKVARRLSEAAALLGLALVIGALAAAVKGLTATDRAAPVVDSALVAEVALMKGSLEEARGRLAVAELKLERSNSILDYSTRYAIPADLAGSIYDAALSEGIHPALGFQIVKVESGFKAGAQSEKGALGYTQIRLPTARGYDSTMTARRLMDRDTNLRLGFRFMKELLDRFDNDLKIALLAYNRGPTLVSEIVDAGGDPTNGYSETVLKGMQSKSRPRQNPAGSGSGSTPGF